MTTKLLVTEADLDEAGGHVLGLFTGRAGALAADLPERIDARIDIHGDRPATLHVAACTVAAAALAVSFFGDRPSELTEADLVDAVLESANVIGGAVKPLVLGSATLGIPSRVGTDWDAAVRTTLEWGGGELTLGFTART